MKKDEEKTISPLEEALASNHVFDQVGQEVRRLRRSRGISIAELAKTIGRSVGFVSQIERGLSRPTVKDLYAISIGLRVQVSWFLVNKKLPPKREEGVIVRAANRRGYESAGIFTEALSPYLGEELEMMVSTMQPNTSFEERVATHQGRETGVILKGKLEMWIDGECFILHKGDSYTFMTNTPHWSRNPGKTETVLLWAVTLL
ncbi:MAG: cupin domain-containing protein [Burkholderiaceae bacterium]|nr:cupin domain-containing protein [Burkholderiaceae bacterium]